MFERAWEYAKQHPLIVGGMVLVGVILIYWYSSSSSSTSAEQSSGIYGITADPNVVAADEAETIAQNQLNAAVSANNSNNATSAQLAQIAAGINTINDSSAVQANADNDNAAIAIAGLQLQATEGQTNAAEAVALGAQDVDLAGLNLSAGITSQALSQAMAMNAALTVSTPLGNITEGTGIGWPQATVGTQTVTPSTNPPAASPAPITPAAAPTGPIQQLFEILLPETTTGPDPGTFGSNPQMTQQVVYQEGTSAENAVATYLSGATAPAGKPGGSYFNELLANTRATTTIAA